MQIIHPEDLLEDHITKGDYYTAKGRLRIALTPATAGYPFPHIRFFAL